MYTYATVCSGVEGASLALNAAPPTKGAWKPIFFSEIEPFPCAILKSNFPNVPNLGDMSKITYKNGRITNGTDVIRFGGRLDLLCGGTPCQDLSVSGLRKGAAPNSNTRSSLIWHFIRLVEELQPRCFVWENVCGTFSSNDGRDFSMFVAKINEIGYSAAWRVFDAQHTRVDQWPMAIPQRRQRVFLVGCPSSDDTRLGEILFEPQSVVGNTPPSRKARQKASRLVETCNQCDDGLVAEEGAAGVTFDAQCGFPVLPETSQTLKNGSCPGYLNGTISSVAGTVNKQCQASNGEASDTLIASDYKEPPVVANVVFNREGMGGETDVSNCIDCSLAKIVSSQQPIIASELQEPMASAGGMGPLNSCASTITACSEDGIDNHTNVIAQVMSYDGYNQTGLEECCHTLRTATGDESSDTTPKVFVKVSHASGKDGEGERWSEESVVGTRNVFDISEVRTQEVVCDCYDRSTRARNPQSNGDVSPTLLANMGTGGNNEPIIALDGDKLKPRLDQRKGGNGFGINEEGVSYTLTVVDRHGVAYKNENMDVTD